MKLAGHDNWPMRLTVTGDDLCLHGVQQLKQVTPSLVEGRVAGLSTVLVKQVEELSC